MEILQYQNILSDKEFHEQAEFLQQTEWRFVGKSNRSSPNFWITELNDNTFFTETLFAKIKELVKADGFDVDLLKVYANGQTYGLSGDFHQDHFNDSHWTFLVYFNHNWSADWAGHTIIKSEEKQEFLSFLPVPNAGLFFRGDLWHVGMEPSRHCTELRTTVAYKLIVRGKNDKPI
jgi:Rps23 Pro-64 3,4-dihydroxylase Tpa1-like proline 4-hydroxylase